MKKLLLLFFTVLSLNLGQGALMAMDKDVSELSLNEKKNKKTTLKDLLERHHDDDIVVPKKQLTPQAQLLDAPDSTTLMNLLPTLNITPKAALLMLVNNTPGAGTNLEEKMNALIEWHNNNKPDIRFKDPNLIYFLVNNYAPNQKLLVDERIQSLPVWIDWFIKHGPHDADGSPIIKSKSPDSVIDLAIFYNNPAAVAMLLQHGQKPSDNGIHYAKSRDFKEVLSVLEPKPVTTTTQSAKQITIDQLTDIIDSALKKDTPEEPNTTAATPPNVSSTGTTTPTTPEPKIDAAQFYAWFKTKQALATVASLIAVYSGYRWLTTSPKAEFTENVLINKAGTNIYLIDSRGLEIHSSQNGNYALPATGTITIKLDTNQIKPLVINLDQSIEKRKTHYLNITVYQRRWMPRILSGWFSPLTYSASWTEK